MGGGVVVVAQAAINPQWQSMKSGAVRWFMMRICPDTPNFTLRGAEFPQGSAASYWLKEGEKNV